MLNAANARSLVPVRIREENAPCVSASIYHTCSPARARFTAAGMRPPEGCSTHRNEGSVALGHIPHLTAAWHLCATAAGSGAGAVEHRSRGGGEYGTSIWKDDALNAAAWVRVRQMFHATAE